MRLFREQGFVDTTVDQIAEAAEVSPSTFFRYFPTKEAVVLADDFDPIFIEAFRAQPADLTPLRAVRRAVRDAVAKIPPDAWDRERDRHRLIAAEPELRPAALEEYLRTYGMFVALIAERVGRPVEELEVRAFAGAVLGVISAATFDWHGNLVSDPMAEVDAALAHLEAGLPL